MGERLGVWEELTGNRIDFHNINVAENYRQLLDLLLSGGPRGHPLRRATGCALLDEVQLPQALHRE